jgi:hypothetical protein
MRVRRAADDIVLRWNLGETEFPEYIQVKATDKERSGPQTALREITRSKPRQSA